MVPELRALRLKEIAMRVKDAFGGDLRGVLAGTLTATRKTLKKFPGIADPGADRILLFAGLAPIAVVPSNCPQVLVRVPYGKEREKYGVSYREAQQAIVAEVPETFDDRTRAYLLLKRQARRYANAQSRTAKSVLSARTVLSSPAIATARRVTSSPDPHAARRPTLRMRAVRQAGVFRLTEPGNRFRSGPKDEMAPYEREDRTPTPRRINHGLRGSTLERRTATRSELTLRPRLITLHSTCRA
jgi:hypothetical protein